MNNITVCHVKPLITTVLVLDGPIILHLYNYQCQDDLILVCVGGSEVMDGEMHFAMPLLLILVKSKLMFQVFL